MSLSPRAIAVQGVGFTPLNVAVQGLWPVGEPPAPPPPSPPRSGSSRDASPRRRPGIFPALPREVDPAAPTPRRTRRRRDAELLLWLKH
jgi:hypothetical protein